MADAARARKVADRIQQTVAQMLERRIKDPRLGFVTITDVRVTGDLQNATIFYTVFGDEKARKDSAAALASAKGMIRSQVGKALGIRLTPHLEFQLDALPETAASLEEKLAQAKAHDEQVAALAAEAQPAGEANPYRSALSEDGVDEDELVGFQGFDDDEL
ncbi:ribosome-binding factor A [Boudabousia tangfeifanii]|uniref:Ribosome-binding factor A n=1 Tax=Boudabousia tangfeifanii TaxID=1912795 RepID=A0A1D9MKR5_9ACTO|nr:30S ribosome-binding factor RbfA [Boudabousia tangfeifanii]AOZ72876.1 ribosome-binding factor A [Boudabousia tangfeifanii]